MLSPPPDLQRPPPPPMLAVFPSNWVQMTINIVHLLCLRLFSYYIHAQRTNLHIKERTSPPECAPAAGRPQKVLNRQAGRKPSSASAALVFAPLLKFIAHIIALCSVCLLAQQSLYHCLRNSIILRYYCSLFIIMCAQ